METIWVIVALAPLVALIFLVALAVKRQRVEKTPRKVDPFRGKPWSGGPDGSGSRVPRKPLVPQGSASAVAAPDYEEEADIAAIGRPVDALDEGPPDAVAQ